jgi:hypothetical protein
MPSPKSLPRLSIALTEDEPDVPTGHGYPTGHEVMLTKRFPPRKAAPGPYKVVAQLPARVGQYQYRVKSGCEPVYRTIAECEIERSSREPGSPARAGPRPASLDVRRAQTEATTPWNAWSVPARPKTSPRRISTVI